MQNAEERNYAPVAQGHGGRRSQMETMNSLRLPKAFMDDQKSGRRPLSIDAIQRLSALLKAVESPFPDLYALDAINGANRLWTSEHVGLYLGKESDEHSPGNIDPGLACMIGQAEPDWITAYLLPEFST